jgi:hypothetical protein
MPRATERPRPSRGVDYAVIVSTCSGAWAYALVDTNPLRLVVAGPAPQRPSTSTACRSSTGSSKLAA